MRFAMLTGLLAFSLVACGDSHESLIKDTLDSMEEMNAIIAKVDSEDSAKSAAKKLQALAEDMKGIKARAEELGDPPKELEKKLEEKYKARFEAVMKETMGNMMKIMQYPELGKAMEEAMKNAPR